MPNLGTFFLVIPGKEHMDLPISPQFEVSILGMLLDWSRPSECMSSSFGLHTCLPDE